MSTLDLDEIERLHNEIRSWPLTEAIADARLKILCDYRWALESAAPELIRLARIGKRVEQLNIKIPTDTEIQVEMQTHYWRELYKTAMSED